jgi:hypothetical protein
MRRQSFVRQKMRWKILRQRYEFRLSEHGRLPTSVVQHLHFGTSMPSGGVSSRARILVFGSARGQLPILHEIECNAGCLKEAGAAKGSRDNLVVTATRPKTIAHSPVLSTKELGGIMAIEAPHTLVGAMTICHASLRSEAEGRPCRAVQDTIAALVELPPAVPAAEPPVASRGGR